MASTGHEQWAAVKKVFIYLQGSFEYSIYYHSDVSGDLHVVDIQGYVDFDWERDVDIMRSTSRYMF
jgi:hypothetical protein